MRRYLIPSVFVLALSACEAPSTPAETEPTAVSPATDNSAVNTVSTDTPDASVNETGPPAVALPEKSAESMQKDQAATKRDTASTISTPKTPPTPAVRPTAPVLPAGDPLKVESAKRIKPSPSDCGVDKVKSYAGKEASVAVRAEVQQKSGAKTIRWLLPNSVATMDYRPDRLNVMLSTDGKIGSFNCG